MDLHLCAHRPTAARQERAASADASVPLSFVFSVSAAKGRITGFVREMEYSHFFPIRPRLAGSAVGAQVFSLCCGGGL